MAYQLAAYEPAEREDYLRLLREAWGEAAMSGAEFDWWFGQNPAGSLRSVARADGRTVGVAGHSLYRMALDGEEHVQRDHVRDDGLRRQRARQLPLEAKTAADARRRAKRMNVDVVGERVGARRLREHDELVDARRQGADLRNRRSERRMIGIDALRDEHEPLHQKKSVSPSVNCQELRSGLSEPASGFPMKSSASGVGTNPSAA